VGLVFGPITSCWFAVLAVLGLGHIATEPRILWAIHPWYGLRFLFTDHWHGFAVLGAVFLAVTGAEALYADLGHFGRAPISRAWFWIVFPACILSYMGQGALILANPTTATSNPFFLLVPHWGQLPMVFLAAAATVIASQAVITGAFSLTQQAAQIGYLPRLRVAHTSEEQKGQIYVPWINWALMIAVLTLVVTFKSSNALAYAFGMAVTGTITITTLLFFYIVRNYWRTSLGLVVPGAAALLAVDLLFFAANLTKFTHGAWLPLLVGLLVFTILTTWQRGRVLVTGLRQREEGPLRPFIEQLRAMKPPLARCPGTAVFLNRGKTTTPLALRANVEHNHILHQHVVILSLETRPVPHIPDAQRLVLDDLGHRDDRITLVTARYGYSDDQNVPALIPLINKAGIESPLDEREITYFLSKIELHRGDTPGMSRWRKNLFLATAHITADAADSFRLPRDRTIIMGARIEF
jgi:KUP system potassium uptake protein